MTSLSIRGTTINLISPFIIGAIRAGHKDLPLQAIARAELIFNGTAK